MVYLVAGQIKFIGADRVGSNRNPVLSFLTVGDRDFGLDTQLLFL